MKKTKSLIIHADDAGLSHSENRATITALKYGIVTSCSIMTNCPWFYEMADFLKKNDRFDYGIHLTLTCEWQTYKFGPVSPVNQVPSLVDENGYFHRNRELVRDNAVASEVKMELIAQIEKGLKFGLKPTHIDSHMYSVGSREDLFEVYNALGKRYGIPVLVNKELMAMAGLALQTPLLDSDLIIDKVFFGKYEYFENGKLKDFYKETLHNLHDGVNLILIHPAHDDTEMKGITVNHPNFGSEWRKIDFDFFTSPECRNIIDEQGIELISWGDLNNTNPLA